MYHMCIQHRYLRYIPASAVPPAVQSGFIEIAPDTDVNKMRKYGDSYLRILFKSKDIFRE